MLSIVLLVNNGWFNYLINRWNCVLSSFDNTFLNFKSKILPFSYFYKKSYNYSIDSSNNYSDIYFKYLLSLSIITILSFLKYLSTFS